MRNTLNVDQKSTYLKERNVVLPQHTGDCVTERYYTVADVARIISLSADKVRRMFQDEPGVLVMGDQIPRGPLRRARQ